VRTLSKYQTNLSGELADDSKAVLQWSLGKIEGLVEDTRRLAQENMCLWRRLGKPKQRKARSSMAAPQVCTTLRHPLAHTRGSLEIWRIQHTNHFMAQVERSKIKEQSQGKQGNCRLPQDAPVTSEAAVTNARVQYSANCELHWE
jgi:hypothetical protein